MTDLRQSKNYANYMRSLGWIVENNFFIKKLWFTSIIKAQHYDEIDLIKIKKYHPFLIKLEPIKNLESRILNLGFKPDNWPLIPSKTLVLDINKIELGKDARYEIRKAEKNNLITKGSSDIKIFYKILEETMKLGKWSIPIRKEVTNLYTSFQPSNSAILLTNYPTNPLPLAGCLLVWDGDTAHYMYAALTKEGREKSAAYLTLWEAIKYCQELKLKYLDLEGIYDERYSDSTKNWKGFTAFKKQWGGKEIIYPGSYTKSWFPF